MVVWLHIYDSKCVVRIYGIATKCVICGVDIHPDIDYTCHDDSSLYVASLVTLGSHLKYGRQIHALQVQGSFHIVLPFEGSCRGRRSGKPVGPAVPWASSFPASGSLPALCMSGQASVCRIGSRRVRENPAALGRICPASAAIAGTPSSGSEAQSRAGRADTDYADNLFLFGEAANLLFS